MVTSTSFPQSTAQMSCAGLFDPITTAHLGEHGPVLGDLDGRQVVVQDRIVQAERFVAVAPFVAVLAI